MFSTAIHRMACWTFSSRPFHPQHTLCARTFVCFKSTVYLALMLQPSGCSRLALEVTPVTDGYSPRKATPVCSSQSDHRRSCRAFSAASRGGLLDRCPTRYCPLTACRSLSTTSLKVLSASWGSIPMRPHPANIYRADWPNVQQHQLGVAWRAGRLRYDERKCNTEDLFRCCCCTDAALFPPYTQQTKISRTKNNSPLLLPWC